ncbi:hypothetical protein V7S76_08610 [Aquirufa sp. ROCK2-A2]
MERPELVSILEKLQEQGSYLHELRDFVEKDSFSMKMAYEQSAEGSDFFYLYDSLLVTISRLDEMSLDCQLALSKLQNSPEWLSEYNLLYSGILLADFHVLFSVDNLDDAYFDYAFPTWKIHKSDLISLIHFLKVYAIMSDFELIATDEGRLRLLSL